MPVSTYAAVALVMVVLGVGLGVGYYAGTSLSGGPATVTSPSTGTAPPTSATTSATSQSASVVTGSCDQAHPLKLTGVSFTPDALSSQEPGYLTTTWANCAGRSLTFQVGGYYSVLTVSALVYGKPTKYLGYIYNQGSLISQPVISSAAAGGSASVSLAVSLWQPYSANAVLQWVAGNATANDPNTGQVISWGLFNATA